MFDRIRTARPAVESDRLRQHVAELQAVLADASAKTSMTAAQLAEQAKVHAGAARQWADPHVTAGVDWARPRVEGGVDWARPRAEKVWLAGKGKAAPHVERAAGAAVPLVDKTHDKLVEDLLPKVVAAVNAAALSTTTGAGKARDITSAKLNELAHIPPPKKSHKGATVLWIVVTVAAVGAALAAWRRRGPSTDPWAEEPWESSASDSSDSFRTRAAEARGEFQGVVEDVRSELGDRAESLGEAAGGAVARTREATERAREATEKAAERARSAKKPGRRHAEDDADTAADATTTQALSTSEVTAASGGAGVNDVPADERLGTSPSTAATPADIADTIGTQLEGTPADPDDSAGSTTIEDGDNRNA